MTLQTAPNALGRVCQNIITAYRPAVAMELRRYNTLSKKSQNILKSSEFGNYFCEELRKIGILPKEMDCIFRSSGLPLSSSSLPGLGQGLALCSSSIPVTGNTQQRRGFKTVRSNQYTGIRGSPQQDTLNNPFDNTSTSRPPRRGSPNAYRRFLGMLKREKDDGAVVEATAYHKFLQEIKHKSKPQVRQQLLEAYGRGMAETTAMMNKGNQKESTFFIYGRRLLSLLIFIGVIHTLNSFRRLMSEIGRDGPRRTNNDRYEVTDVVDVCFEDVKGCDEAKKELEDIVEFLRNPERFNKLGARLPKGVLLTGQPGVGKTLLARAVAGEAKVPFLHAAGSEFDELFVGTGASRMRKLFEEAKSRAPCVIFIDEIDAVSSTRTSSPTHPYANQTINQLLSELDGFRASTGIIVLGATNRRSSLDPAVVRPGRFDMEIVVQIPDNAGRKAILELYLSKVKNIGIDINNLAMSTIGFTGADIENLINQAALLAGLENVTEVTMDHIWKARDKMLMGPARERLQDEETNKVTAFHEAGHALVAYFTAGSQPIHKITLIPRGRSLGATSFIPEKELHNETFQSLKALMDVNMGGRVAEEIIFGAEHVTTGAQSDFQNATSIAETMVKQYGMSDAVGVRVLSNEKSQVSEATRQVVDNEVKRLLTESYTRARNIIVSHSKEHKAIAEALLKYETLSREDMIDIIKGRKPKVAIEFEKKEEVAKEELNEQRSYFSINSLVNIFGGRGKDSAVEKEELVEPIDSDNGDGQRR